MFNTVRRGPASVARSILLPSKPLRFIQSIRNRHHCRSTTSILSLRFIRAHSTTSQWGQRALASRELEQEIEEECQPEPPPLDRPMREEQRGPITKFEDLATNNLVCNAIVDTITNKMGLETMTHVQSLTINESLKGTDILAQARTGTGKTLAFLIPVFQNIIRHNPTLEKPRPYSRTGSSSSKDIKAIIISPTRELAEQIAVEARKIASNTGVIVQTAVGGSSKREGLMRIKREGCHVLVGTPGRLNDLLSDPYSSVRAPNLSAFVLDEADRLLDQGFAPEIESIQKSLPDRRDVDRQTLLFSATVPQEVMKIVRKTAKPDFKFVRTVQEGEQQTHERVPQKIVHLGGMENSIPALLELAKREMAREGSPPFKAIVYFNATAEVTLASDTFRNLRNSTTSEFPQQHPLYPAKILEIHAKLSQTTRSLAADRFRRAESAILLSSDVTARGMDFPNVTHVIQLGLPPYRELYIHRIGRTARAGKEGQAWIFLTNLETRDARRRLTGLPLKPDTSLETAKVDMTKDASLPESTANILKQVITATAVVDHQTKKDAYMASLGVYGWVNDKQALIDTMNQRARYGWSMETPPGIRRALVLKLGLRNVEGINLIERDTDFSEDARGGSSRGSFDGRGRSSYGKDRATQGYSRGGRGGGAGFSRNDRSDRGGSRFAGNDQHDRDRGVARDGYRSSSVGGGYGTRSSPPTGYSSSDRLSGGNSYGRYSRDRSAAQEGGDSSNSGSRGSYGGSRGRDSGRGGSKPPLRYDNGRRGQAAARKKSY